MAEKPPTTESRISKGASPNSTAKITRSKPVPQKILATYESILALTDAFCRDHLDDDYRTLAQRMAATLCRMRISPVSSGQPRTWACGIIYVLGQINFLSDPGDRIRQRHDSLHPRRPGLKFL